MQGRTATVTRRTIGNEENSLYSNLQSSARSKVLEIHDEKHFKGFHIKESEDQLRFIRKSRIKQGEIERGAPPDMQEVEAKEPKMVVPA
jgi:hypothetical protein